jgi:hypothetical protein
MGQISSDVNSTLQWKLNAINDQFKVIYQYLNHIMTRINNFLSCQILEWQCSKQCKGFWYPLSLWDFRLSRWWVWSLESSGMYCYVVKLMLTNVSEVHTASIIRAMTHHPDDGGSTHLWKVAQHQLDYTAVHPRRHLNFIHCLVLPPSNTV